MLKNPAKRKWQSSREFYWRSHHTSAFYRSGKNPLSLCDVQIITGNAVKTKRWELANSGEAVQFLNPKNEVQNTFTLFFWEKLNPEFT